MHSDFFFWESATWLLMSSYCGICSWDFIFFCALLKRQRSSLFAIVIIYSVNKTKLLSKKKNISFISNYFSCYLNCTSNSQSRFQLENVLYFPTHFVIICQNEYKLFWKYGNKCSSKVAGVVFSIIRCHIIDAFAFLKFRNSKQSSL